MLEHLGVPAWLAQRLWVGHAVPGRRHRRVVVCPPARAEPPWRLGRGLVYQLSPYVLPYVSRTSVLLSPWAGLGWLVGLTILAGRRGGWRYPALFALVVATVGGINATAIALIAVAPVLWLVHAGARHEGDPLAGGRWRPRRAPRRRSRSSSRSGGSSRSLVQSRYGADVLAYSETVQAVSSTSLASEVLRGLGYWLFYGGDVTGRWTGASTPYLQSPGLIGLGFALAGLGLLGILFVRWRERTFLAGSGGGRRRCWPSAPTGRHRSPTRSQGSARSTLVLALRSSTRAVPVLLLGLGTRHRGTPDRVVPSPPAGDPRRRRLRSRCWPS